MYVRAIASLEAAAVSVSALCCLRCCSGAGHNISLCVLEGTTNSPDIWNAVNGLNQQGYEGALGAATSLQTQPGSYASMQPHSHLVRFTSSPLHTDTRTLGPPADLTEPLSLAVQDYSPLSVMAADMNRGLPPMSSFHRNNTPSRTTDNSTGDEALPRFCSRFIDLKCSTLIKPILLRSDYCGCEYITNRCLFCSLR